MDLTLAGVDTMSGYLQTPGIRIETWLLSAELF